MTNRVLCLVPLVAWFEDWMFVRKFKMMDTYWCVPVEVVGEYSALSFNPRILFNDIENVIGDDMN